MANKEENTLLKIVLLFGGLYFFKHFFEKSTEPQKIARISGIYIRDLIPYEDSVGKKVFYKELCKLTDNEASEVISKMIIPARKVENLEYPLYKGFKGTTITGELRFSYFRILLYEISENEYLMLNIFKKKRNDTPLVEIRKAEKRIAEYLAAL